VVIGSTDDVALEGKEENWEEKEEEGEEEEMQKFNKWQMLN
jgi:hypothetical protein